jgi:ankyrin repeat protein
MYAVIKCKTLIAEELLKSIKININEIDNDGYSALIHAIKYTAFDFSCAHLLIDRPEVDVNITTFNQGAQIFENALICLIRRSGREKDLIHAVELLKKLVKKPGVDLNIRLKIEESIPRRKKSVKYVDMIVGTTPLMYAAMHDFVQYARILLRAGANPHLHDKLGRTAAQIGRDEKHFSIPHAIDQEEQRRLANWMRKKGTLNARMHIAMFMHHLQLPADIAAMVTRDVYVNTTAGSDMTDQDKKLFDKCNTAIVSQAYLLR